MSEGEEIYIASKVSSESEVAESNLTAQMIQDGSFGIEVPDMQNIPSGMGGASMPSGMGDTNRPQGMGMEGRP